MTRTPVLRSRHQRHRQFDRTRRGGRFLAWLDRIVTALAGTATGKTFTTNFTTGLFTSVAHGFANGAGPIVLTNSGGALPAGLNGTTLYFINRLTADTFKLSTDREHAAEGKGLVAFTGNGTGTHTAKRAITREGIFDQLQERNSERLEAETDIDNLN